MTAPMKSQQYIYILKPIGSVCTTPGFGFIKSPSDVHTSAHHCYLKLWISFQVLITSAVLCFPYFITTAFKRKRAIVYRVWSANYVPPSSDLNKNPTLNFVSVRFCVIYPQNTWDGGGVSVCVLMGGGGGCWWSLCIGECTDSGLWVPSSSISVVKADWNLPKMLFCGLFQYGV